MTRLDEATTRFTLLQALVRCQQSISPLVEALSKFSWDCPSPIVVLTAVEVRIVLDSYLNGVLTAEGLSEWADAIECREDIGFVMAEEDSIKKSLFELANPELEGQITPSSVRRLCEGLKRP